MLHLGVESTIKSIVETHLYNLTKMLITDYDPWIRPVIYHNTTIKIDISLTLLQIVDVVF